MAITTDSNGIVYHDGNPVIGGMESALLLEQEKATRQARLDKQWERARPVLDRYMERIERKARTESIEG